MESSDKVLHSYQNYFFGEHSLTLDLLMLLSKGEAACKTVSRIVYKFSKNTYICVSIND